MADERVTPASASQASANTASVKTSPAIPAASLTDPARPIAEGERVEALDVLRGFALLGILVPNIVVFSWPMQAMTSPAAMGGGPANEWGYRVTAIFFLTKMMMLFAMLFGAGTLFFARKYDNARSVTDGYGRWFARTGWLLVIGLAHGIGLWYGDILVWYAVAGIAALWWVRRFSGKTLLVGGAASFALGSIVMILFSLAGVFWARQQGDMSVLYGADLQTQIDTYQGGYAGIVQSRILTLLMMWFFGIMWAPGIIGLMVTGMALVKLGVFTAERSARFYSVMAAIGIGLGLPLTVGVFAACQAWDPEYGSFLFQSLAQPVGIPLGLGYAGLIILIVKKQWLAPLRAALRAVGRTALTCYLMQTILATTFFYGYGLGYYAKIDYPNLFLVVGAIWAINIVFALVWLRFFRMGPAEWAWRSLTYLRLQPLRR